MATSVDEIIRDVIGSVETEVGSPLVARWINNRYQELVSRVRFRHLRRIGELSLPAVVSSGSVSATRGSTTITPDATAQAALNTSPGAGTHEYWYVRVNSVWYKIASIGAGGSSITLATAYAEDTVADASYRVVKRYHALDATVRWFGDFVFERLRYPLENLNLDELNMLYPSRILTGHYPTHVVHVGVDTSGNQMVEIYPPPETTEMIKYVYWRTPVALTFTSDIPLVIEPKVLKEGSLVDLYRYEKSRQINRGNVEAAAIYANEEAKQRRIWEQNIKDAIRTSRAADDITFLLTMNRGMANRTSDQRTARDYVLDNWRHP